MTLLISYAALFASVAMVQLGAGGLAPLDALSGAALGFTTAEIGAMGSAQFAGFFLGCWLAPRLMGAIGHSRAFAAFAAATTIGALAHPLWTEPPFWMLLRALSGLGIAGCYTIIEGWLQAKTPNASRGRVFGVYRVVDISASVLAQGVVAVLPPAVFVSYNLLAIVCCLSLLPLALTRGMPPAMPRAPRLRPLATLRLSPLGAAGAIATGATMPPFRMVGPVYGQEMGLDAQGIALFLAAALVGGALAQAPVGWLADKLDRRAVLVALSLAAAAVSVPTLTGAADTPEEMIAVSFLFGLVAIPIYSVSSALANDFAPPDMVVEVNASLIFLFGVGAVASPWVAALLMELAGPRALFAQIAAAHLALAAWGLWRMTRRAAPEKRRGYTYLPRTSFVLARLGLKRNGDGPPERRG